MIIMSSERRDAYCVHRERRGTRDASRGRSDARNVPREKINDQDVPLERTGAKGVPKEDSRVQGKCRHHLYPPIAIDLLWRPRWRPLPHQLQPFHQLSHLPSCRPVQPRRADPQIAERKDVVGTTLKFVTGSPLAISLAANRSLCLSVCLSESASLRLSASLSLFPSVSLPLSPSLNGIQSNTWSDASCFVIYSLFL